MQPPHTARSLSVAAEKALRVGCGSGDWTGRGVMRIAARSKGGPEQKQSLSRSDSAMSEGWAETRQNTERMEIMMSVNAVTGVPARRGDVETRVSSTRTRAEASGAQKRPFARTAVLRDSDVFSCRLTSIYCTAGLG
eukprot:scaffold10206_cov63-Phaeocystis_antarctica.AAC.5